MKLAFLFIITAAIGMVTIHSAQGQSPLPPPTGYVNDYARVIDETTKNNLEQTLANLDHREQIQFAVVTVDTTNGQEIYDYSLAVARGWGIGAKDSQKPALLLLVSIKDRKYYTQVSRHLEGELPDGLVGQIQRERLVPAFRAGDYGRGLSDTVTEYLRTVATKRGFSTDAIFVGAPTPQPERTASPSASRSSNVCGIVVFAAVIIVLILILMRRGGGSGFGGGWFPWLLINLFLNSGGRSSSGWSSGGFGGYSGGGGSSGGGFGGFGGGGDFGGGGSGGSW